jgi:DNA-binding XRE family transcriptional regulator
MTPAEFRAAYEGMGMTQQALADVLDIGLRTVQAIVAGNTVDPLYAYAMMGLMLTGIAPKAWVRIAHCYGGGAWHQYDKLPTLDRLVALQNKLHGPGSHWIEYKYGAAE